MKDRLVFPSLTRISDLKTRRFASKVLDRSKWENGDYVLCKVTSERGGHYPVELVGGRMASIMNGDLIVGALGVRHATLEATGSWEFVGPNGKMSMLTGAGLVGKLTSRSSFIPPLTKLQYKGHVIVDGQKRNMRDYVKEVPEMRFEIPVILLVGTSMSAGKTTAARVVTHQLKKMGLKVVAGKLSGAGRYQDILSIKDAGADEIYDFVDTGLPSSICSRPEYHKALDTLLSLLAASQADVAVIEVGASPLEPYNGDMAIKAIQDYVRCTILCASDPYAVSGVMQSFEVHPSIVTGPASNTLGGRDLIKKLCGVKALDLLDVESLPDLRHILKQKISIGQASST